MTRAESRRARRIAKKPEERPALTVHMGDAVMKAMTPHAPICASCVSFKQGYCPSENPTWVCARWYGVLAVTEDRIRVNGSPGI